MAGLRIWLSVQLRRLAQWCDPTPILLVAIPRDAQYERALTLMRGVALLHASGEYKRHSVYAQLLKEYPATQPRELGLLIEAIMAEEWA